MASAHEYITELASRGRYHFTTEEARATLGSSVVAVRAVLRRLACRGEIASPYRGFHVIVPPDYRQLGCLPAEQFVPHLMAHLGEHYYVALLSAAELHGAAHQRPQSFQVMVAKNRRRIECGQVRVRFIARHDLRRTPAMEVNTPRGRLRVASAEATALELVGYARHCGGLDNVASILAELAEVVENAKLLDAASLCSVAWVQRLGYMLEEVGHAEPASVLADYVQEHATVVVPLLRSKSMVGARRAERWKLAVNASVEPDL